MPGTEKKGYIKWNRFIVGINFVTGPVRKFFVKADKRQSRKGKQNKCYFKAAQLDLIRLTFPRNTMAKPGLGGFAILEHRTELGRNHVPISTTGSPAFDNFPAGQVEHFTQRIVVVKLGFVFGDLLELAIRAFDDICRMYDFGDFRGSREKGASVWQITHTAEHLENHYNPIFYPPARKMSFTTFPSGITADKFLTYLKEVLIPTLRPDNIRPLAKIRDSDKIGV